MSSNSKASTSSQTTANTTTTYNTTDQRVGVDGQGNIGAGAGAVVTVQNLDADVAKEAFDAATKLTDTVINGNVDVSGKAIGAVQEGFSELTTSQSKLVEDLINANQTQTEANQTSTNALAQQFLEKTVNAMTDSKTSADQTIVTTGIKYISGAVIAVSVLFGLLAFSRKK